MTEVDVLGLLEVQERKTILKITDLVADRNLVGNGEDAVHEGFPKDGDFDFDFLFGHNF